MATLSKLIAVLLRFEKEDPDKRRVVVKNIDSHGETWVFDISRVEEGEWEGKKKIILWGKEI